MEPQPNWYHLPLDLWKLILKHFHLQDIYLYIPRTSKFFNHLVNSMEQNDYDKNLLDFHLDQHQSYWCKSLDLFKKSCQLKIPLDMNLIHTKDYIFKSNFESPFTDSARSNNDFYFCCSKNDIVIVFQYIYDYISIHQIDTINDQLINLGIINFRELGYYCFKNSGFWIQKGERFVCLLYEKDFEINLHPFPLIYCLVQIYYDRDQNLCFDYKILKSNQTIAQNWQLEFITNHNDDYNFIIIKQTSVDHKINLIHCRNFNLDPNQIQIVEQSNLSLMLPFHIHNYAAGNKYIAIIGHVKNRTMLSIFYLESFLKPIKEIHLSIFIDLIKLEQDEIPRFDLVIQTNKDDQNIIIILIIEVYETYFDKIKRQYIAKLKSNNHFEFDNNNKNDFYETNHSRYFQNIYKTLSTICQIKKNFIKVLDKITN